MPRNGSGSMSVPNSFSSGTTASSSAVNANFTDVASEITNSLPRDGQAAMTGPMKAATGSASSPSMTFGSDTDTGFYRKSSDTIGIAVGGTEIGDISSRGISLIPTGVILPYGATTAPTGWVRANGRTVGNAASSATERANADTETLFAFLWTHYSDSVCAVSTGRGASAAADYAANKTITLPDMRGRSFFGLDDMGSTDAGRLGTVITSDTTNGATGGAETVTLSESQLPSHTHGNSHTHSVSGMSSTEDIDHTHTYSGTTSAGGTHSHTYSISNDQNAAKPGGTGGGSVNQGLAGGTTSTEPNHTHTFSGTTSTVNTAHRHSISLTSGTPSTAATNAAGSGAAHSNMPPAFLGTWIMKL